MKISFSRIAAVLVTAAAVISGSATNVMAAGTTYTPVTGGTIKVYQYLTLDTDATVPNLSIGATIAAGAAQNASGTNAAVTSGVTPANVVITPAAFTPATEAYASAQTIPADTGTRVAEGATDPITLDSNKYARSAMTLNFSGVSFNEPGVYRYIITNDNTAKAGVTYDAVTTRVLDVYVLDDGTGALQAPFYVLHKSASDAAVPVDGSAPSATKAQGFVNSLTSSDLTISKTVTGNQASRDEYFEFTVNITGAGNGTVFTVGGDYDTTTVVTGNNPTTHTNPTTVTANATGAASATFWLQGGQDVVLQGILPGTAYTIGENKTTIDNEGYTPSATINGTAASFVTDTYNVSGSIASADVAVAFTNAKSGTVPTGVLTSVLPGLLLLGCAAGGIFIIAKRKKENESAE